MVSNAPGRQWRMMGACLGLVVGWVAGSAATGRSGELPDFVPVAWLPVAASALAKASTVAAGLSPEAGRHQIGDTITILAQITADDRVRQWAVMLSLSDTQSGKKELRSPAFTLHLSNGSKVDFGASTFEGMAIHVLGPFSKSKGAARAKDVRSAALVNAEYLGLGLQGTVRLWQRLIEHSRNDPELVGKQISLEVSTGPVPPAKVAEHRALVDRLAITVAEERAYAGFMPAVMDFFRIASQTPGVREIIFDVADVPWWSILANGGRITETRFEIVEPFETLSPGDWGLPETMDVYAMGLVLHLQGNPALVCRLALTAPRPPLLNSAGIIGVAAMRPDGKGPRVMFRVMAGRVAADGRGKID